MMQKAEAIVIRTSDYGESNKIVTLYTREFGKVAVMARGAKKPRSRLTAICQLFIHGLYLFQKSSGVSTLQQGEMLHSLREVRNDLVRASYASYIVELTDKLTNDKEPNSYLFELLLQTMTYINDDIDPEILVRIFDVKMLAVAGIKPELNCCVTCSAVEGDFSFSIKEGGFLCHRCLQHDPYRMKIMPSTAKLLRLFFYFDLARLGNISVKSETKKELNDVLSAYYQEYSGLSLKSKRFLDQLERTGFLSHDEGS